MSPALLAISLVMAASGPTWVLGPGQDRLAERLVDLANPQVLPGVTLEGVSLDVDHVRVLMKQGAGRLEGRIYAPEDARPATVPTLHGRLWLPEGAPDGLQEALRVRLVAAKRGLSWRSLVERVDPAEGNLASERLERRVRLRLGLDTGETSDSFVNPELREPLSQIRSGQLSASRDALRPVLARSDPPPGAVSLWLASGPPRPGPCEPGGRCPMEELLHDLEEGRFDPQWSARWAHEPRVLVQGARSAAVRTSAARWCRSAARGLATGVVALAAGGSAARRNSARSSRPAGGAARSSAQSW